MSSSEGILEQKIQNSYKNLKHPVIMPTCADFLLSQINENKTSDEISSLFREYFSHGAHHPFSGIQNTDSEKDLILKNLLCSEVIFGPPAEHDDTQFHAIETYNEIGCCLSCSCIKLNGDRRLNLIQGNTHRVPILTIGDGVFVYYMERMGIFKILGAILDDFANNGKLPIPNNNTTALILEKMVNLFQTGESSTTQARARAIAKSIGWGQQGQNTLIDREKTLINSAFSSLMTRALIQLTRYYHENRVTLVIQGISGAQPPSVATLVALQDTISLLRNAAEPFNYGKNYYDILNSIVWILATIDLVKRLRDTLGIPLSYERLDQIIPAAYSILVDKKSINTSEPNRFKLLMGLARDGRNIVMDLVNPAINFENIEELKTWTRIIEPHVQSYVAAFQELTGIDLGKQEIRTEGSLKIEQQL
jgi:hypothetical protein